jgi:DNA-binding protein H-NS
MNWDDLVYLMVFLVLAFIPSVKKQQVSKPKAQNTKDDARCLEEARKKIEMLKRQRRANESEVQTRAPQAKSTVEDLLRESSIDHLKPHIDVVRSKIEQPYACVKCTPASKLRVRTKKSVRLRQWIIGQIVLERRFNTHY